MRPLYIALALAPIVGAVAWWLSRTDRLDADALARVAAERGWTAHATKDADEEAVELLPPDHAWTLRVSHRLLHVANQSHARRSSGLQTAWTAPATSPKGILAIRPGQAPSGPLAPPPAMLAPLFATAVNEMTGGHVEDVGSLATLARIEVGDSRFDDGYVVVASSPAFGAFLASPVQRDAVVAACATGAAVVLSPAGVRLGVEGEAWADGAKLDALVAAGRALQAAWSPQN